MSKWSELSHKKELTDSDRVAIAAVLEMSVGAKSNRTMDEIFDELLGTYNHLFAHCDPLPRVSTPDSGQGPSTPSPAESTS